MTTNLRFFVNRAPGSEASPVPVESLHLFLRLPNVASV